MVELFFGLALLVASMAEEYGRQFPPSLSQLQFRINYVKEGQSIESVRNYLGVKRCRLLMVGGTMISRCEAYEIAPYYRLELRYTSTDEGNRVTSVTIADRRDLKDSVLALIFRHKADWELYLLHAPPAMSFD